jgi:hypothetical protein
VGESESRLLRQLGNLDKTADSGARTGEPDPLSRPMMLPRKSGRYLPCAVTNRYQQGSTEPRAKRVRLSPPSGSVVVRSVLAQTPVTAWMRPSAMALTKLS